MACNCSNCISKEEAIEKANCLANEELDEFNKAERSRELGGPFLLKDYNVEVNGSVFEGKDIFIISYEYSKPASFLGHPQHFSVWVYCDTGETRFFGGE